MVDSMQIIAQVEVKVAAIGATFILIRFRMLVMAFIMKVIPMVDLAEAGVLENIGAIHLVTGGLGLVVDNLGTTAETTLT